MSSYLEYFFGPLPEYYCLYFYAVSVFAAIVAAIALINVVFLMFSKGGNRQIMGTYIMLFTVYFVLYFQNRLLNTICEKSLA